MPSSVSSLLAPLARFYVAAGLALPVAEVVAADEVPLQARGLLKVPGPLTPRLEDHHGESLALRVIERSRNGDAYARRVVLVRRDGAPVVLGAIEIDLARLPPKLRAEVLAEEVPFGHILGTALAWPDAFLRLTPDALIAAALAVTPNGKRLYGRRRTLRDAAGVTVAAIVDVLPPT